MEYFNDNTLSQRKEKKTPTCQSERYNKPDKKCDCGCKHKVPVTVNSFKESVKYFSL